MHPIHWSRESYVEVRVLECHYFTANVCEAITRKLTDLIALIHEWSLRTVRSLKHRTTERTFEHVIKLATARELSGRLSYFG